MLYLKEANVEDAAKEYAFVSELPQCENGFTNECPGVSEAEFTSRVLPRMIAFARGEGLPKGLALALEYARSVVREDEIYMSVNRDNAASLRVQQKNGAYVHHADDKQYYTRIKL